MAQQSQQNFNCAWKPHKCSDSKGEKVWMDSNVQSKNSCQHLRYFNSNMLYKNESLKLFCRKKHPFEITAEIHLACLSVFLYHSHI